MPQRSVVCASEAETVLLKEAKREKHKEKSRITQIFSVNNSDAVAHYAMKLTGVFEPLQVSTVFVILSEAAPKTRGEGQTDSM